MALNYRLRVDWGGDETFGHPQADVIREISQPLVAKRGREYRSQLYGLSVPGDMTVSLRNDDKRFSNLSQQSSLQGLVLPRRKVEFATRQDTAADWTPLWSGYVETVREIERRSERDEVLLVAKDILLEVTRRRITSQMHEIIRCDAAARIVLDNAGVPSNAIGVLDAPRIIPRWWAGHQLAIEALRQIEETEGGVLFVDGDGRIRLDRSYARIRGARRNEVAIFSDDKTANSIGMVSLNLRDPSQSIANIVRARVRRYTAGAETVLWELEAPIALQAGQSTTIVAEYEAGVAAWTSLVSGTDYVANTMEDGSGTDSTGDLTVAEIDRGSELRVTITNNGLVTLYLFPLQARGQPLEEGQPIIVEERSQSSINTYGEREYLTEASYLGTYADARDYARYNLSLLSQPQRRASLSFYAADDETLARTLNVGDRVSLIARGVGTSMFVENIEHRLDSGLVHTLTLELSPADVYASTIVLDFRPGLDMGILGR